MRILEFAEAVSPSKIMGKQYVIGCQFANFPFAVKTPEIPRRADRMLPHIYVPFFPENHSMTGRMPTQIQDPEIRKESPFFRNREGVKSGHFSSRPQMPEINAARRLKKAARNSSTRIFAFTISAHFTGMTRRFFKVSSAYSRSII